MRVGLFAVSFVVGLLFVGSGSSAGPAEAPLETLEFQCIDSQMTIYRPGAARVAGVAGGEGPATQTVARGNRRPATRPILIPAVAGEY